MSPKISSYQWLGPEGSYSVAYTQWGARKKDGVPVLCVHGLVRNGRDFDDLAKTLAKTTQVLCPDMPGRGHSDDLPTPDLYAMPTYLSVCTELFKMTGAKQVDWVGTSMGGIIGMLLAAQPNSFIRRLVLNDVGPVFEAEALTRIGSYLCGTGSVFLNETEVEAFVRKIYSVFGPMTDENWKHLARHATRTLPDGRMVMAYDRRIGVAYQRMSKDINLWETYDAVKCPTLLIRGESSDLLSPAIAQDMTRRGPKAKLVTIPGAGHAPSLMEKSQIQHVTDFLLG